MILSKQRTCLHDKNLVRFIRWSSPKGLQDERSLRKSGDFRKAITLAKELSWGEFIKIVYADVSFWVLSIFFLQEADRTLCFELTLKHCHSRSNPQKFAILTPQLLNLVFATCTGWRIWVMHVPSTKYFDNSFLLYVTPSNWLAHFYMQE